MKKRFFTKPWLPGLGLGVAVGVGSTVGEGVTSGACPPQAVKKRARARAAAPVRMVCFFMVTSIVLWAAGRPAHEMI